MSIEHISIMWYFVIILTREKVKVYVADRFNKIW
jgi:hypothetical protein